MLVRATHAEDNPHRHHEAVNQDGNANGIKDVHDDDASAEDDGYNSSEGDQHDQSVLLTKPSTSRCVLFADALRSRPVVLVVSSLLVHVAVARNMTRTEFGCC